MGDANRHRHPLVGVRGCPKELADEVRAAAEADGKNLSEVTVAYWRRYVAAAKRRQRTADPS